MKHLKEFILLELNLDRNLNILCEEMGHIYKALLLHRTVYGRLKEKNFVQLSCELK